MQKRGQVTIFLIMGIVILAVFASIFYITSLVQKEELKAEAEELPVTFRAKTPVQSLVESCLRNTAIPGIYLLGIQGGVIYPDEPELILLTENNIINYGYLNGINQFSERKMERDLNRFLEESLPSCLDFSILEDQAIIVEERGELKADVKIRNRDLRVDLEYPLDVTIGGDVSHLEKYSVLVKIPISELIAEAEKIIEQHKQNPGQINFGFLATLDTFVSVLPYSDDTIIYSVSDIQTVIDGAPFTFMFAIYDQVNNPPELDLISDFVLRKSSTFTYRLTASDPDDDILTFSSDSELFSVSGDLVSATLNQAETYFVTFTVEDENGLKDEQEVRFVVE